MRLGFAAALLILAGIAAASLVRMNRFADGAQWVNHTHEVIEGLDGVLSGITDAETAQRGFLLTADESYLVPYAECRATLASRLESVKQLTLDNASQRSRVTEVEALIAQRVALLEAGIQARRATAGPLQLASQHFANGRAAMDGVRRLIGEMEREETNLLKARSAALEHDRSTAKLIILIGNGVALILLCVSFTVLVREIKQREEAEVRARRYAVQIEDLYNKAPCGYHSLDGDGMVVQINDTELAWLGYTREEVVDRKRFSELLTPESRAHFEANFVEFKRQGIAHDVEYELVGKDGRTLPVSLSATLVRDAAGRYVMSRSTLFDITERRQADQELHRANAFLDSVLEHIPSMIFVKDADELRYLRLNRAGETMLGQERSAVIGRTDHDLFAPEQAVRFIEQDREVLSSGQMLNIAEDELVTSAGERILHTRKLAIRDEHGKPRYLLGISEDVTERRRAERKIGELHQTLETRAQQLEATNKELESFSYSVSHDLRSPLRAIDGFSRILEEDHTARLDDEGLRLLAVVRSNTQRMAQLIDDLLTFSRLGRQAVVSLGVRMSALAREAWDQVCAEEGAPRLIMGSLPDAIGDPVLLRQVWTNLLSNAVKYSGTRSEPVVEVSARSEDANVIYCVRDNGVGFDMRYSDKLFGVFQRLHSMDEFPGTGVGLAIVKRVITRHGGRVWAQSVLNEGAQFYFSLPRGRPDERA
jgi:PAS domain S-box-containing protein